MNRLAFPLLAALALLAACKPPASPSPAPSSRLSAVVTNSILADAVKNIGGADVEIVTLVGPDGDPHTYEPAPSDMKAVANAGLYFENGMGLEPWSDKLFQASGSAALRVTATDGIKPIELKESAEHDSHTHREVDPHVWNDVENYILMAKNVKEALLKKDPAHAESYRANAESYLKKLKVLDDWVKEQAASLPREKRKLVTNHDVFGYFANRYGFEILGNAVGSLTTESHDPSAAHLVELTLEIKNSGVRTVFGDFSSNPKLIAQVAQEAGVKIGPKLFIDSLGAPGTEGDTYEKMMRYNVSSLVENLK